MDSDSAAARDEELAAFLAAPAPRRVPARFAKKAQAQVVGWFAIIFCAVFGTMSLMFTSTLEPLRQVDDWRLSGENVISVPGRIVAAKATNTRVNGEHVWSYDFVFNFGDRETAGSCYAPKGRWQDGAEVTVRYLPNNPAVALAEGGRLNRGGLFFLFELIFPVMGFGLVAWALIERRRALELLIKGRLAEAVVESVTPTSAKAGGRRVFEIKLRAVNSGDGTSITARFHRPEIVALAESRLASGQPVYFLCDPARPNRVIFPEAL